MLSPDSARRTESVSVAEACVAEPGRKLYWEWMPKMWNIFIREICRGTETRGSDSDVTAVTDI